MSSIQLTDNFGFSLKATNGADNANFFKRLLADAQFVFDVANVKAAETLPLGADPGPTLPFTLTAKGSAAIGANGVASLKIDGTCTAKLSKTAGDELAEALNLFDAELPDGTDTKTAGYLSFETSAQLNVGVSGTVNEFTFGMTEGKTVTLSNSRFYPQLVSTKLADATRELLTDFVIPAELSDLQFLPVENICSISGKGSLKFEACVGYQFFANPLTSIDIPVAGALAVNACGNASVDLAVTISSGFKISVLKNGQHTVRLAVARSHDTDVDAGFKVNPQITATVNGKDRLPMLLSAISPNADREIQQMNAKLSDDERDAIEGALNCAIQTNFELALQGDAENLFGREILFLYELDLNALSERGKAALESALKGDFTGLGGATQQDGVTEVHSVFAKTKTSTFRLSVHLLNVFQAGSVSSMISKETVKATPGGDLAIIDAATGRGINFMSLVWEGGRLTQPAVHKRDGHVGVQGH